MKYLIILLTFWTINVNAAEYTGFDLYSRNEACSIAKEKARYLTNHAALNKCSCARQGIFWKCSVSKQVKAKPVILSGCKK